MATTKREVRLANVCDVERESPPIKKKKKNSFFWGGERESGKITKRLPKLGVACPETGLILYENILGFWGKWRDIKGFGQ